MFKRFLPIVGVLGIMSVALAGTAAAGGGGYGGPGKFTFSDWSAQATIIDGTGNFLGLVTVDRGAQSFRPKGKSGGVPFEQNATTLAVNTPTGYGCWVIPDSAFIVASNLSSASLHISADASMVCPGFLVSGAAGGRPGLQSVIGMGGGPGGGTQLTAITVDMTWTGNGALWENQNSGSSRCLSYKATNKGTFDYEYAAAAGSVGDLAGSADPYAQIGHSTMVNTANSNPAGACNPPGF